MVVSMKNAPINRKWDWACAASSGTPMPLSKGSPTGLDGIVGASPLTCAEKVQLGCITCHPVQCMSTWMGLFGKVSTILYYARYSTTVSRGLSFWGYGRLCSPKYDRTRRPHFQVSSGNTEDFGFNGRPSPRQLAGRMSLIVLVPASLNFNVNEK